MCRTTLNVTGDLTAAVVISRGEPNDEQPAELAATDGAGLTGPGRTAR